MELFSIRIQRTFQLVSTLMIVNPVNERAILVSSVGTNFNNTLLDSQLTVDGLDIIVNNERN